MKPSCTLQVFHNQAWLAAAQLTVSSAQGGAAAPCTLGYDLAHAIAHAGRCDALAIAYTEPVTLAPAQHNQWPAYLIDHLPQGFGRSELLRQLGLPERAEASADWTLLLHGAGNPIGNWRVKEAYDYIAQRTAHQTQSQTSGFTFEEVAQRGAAFTEYLASHGLFVAGSSGVQGEWPKILLTEDAQGHLHLDHDLPDDQARRHWLVKFARGADKALAKILRLEAIWMALAKHLGLRTQVGESAPGIVHLYGRALFVERFDRAVVANAQGQAQNHARVLRRSQESLYSLCGVGGFSGKLSHNQAVQTLAHAATDPAAEIMEYLRRDIANVVLGNKDNHGRNTAVTRMDAGVQLTPVFDFCPMYLHPDGIARRMRWEDAAGRADNGQPDWQVALGVAQAALRDSHADASQLEHGLQEIGARLATLLSEMKALGVDKDVIAFLRPVIDSNTQLLHG